MALAGETLVAGRIPGEYIFDEQITNDVLITNERTVVASITAPVFPGRVYWFGAEISWNSDTDNSELVAEIVEDNVNGQTRQQVNVEIPSADDFSGYPSRLIIRHTATIAGNKTFVVTGRRTSGTGQLRMEAQSNRPCFTWVQYIRG